MKTLALFAAAIGAVILPTVASAQTNYLAQEIVPAETTGQMDTAALNNNGEAAFTYVGSSNRVELWLPKARNGLPAGSTKVASVAGFIKLTDSLRWAFSFSSDRYYWDGVLHQLPLYPGMTDTYLNDLNDNGTMVGQSVNRNSTNTNTKTAAHVINGGLFSDFWEILPGSGPTEKYWPYRINKVGDIAGQHTTEVYNGAAWQHTLTGAFLRRNGVVHHIPPAGPAIGEQWTVYDLNEKGQVLVLRQPPAGSGQPQKFYLYLPVVDYGWPSAGLIGPVTEYSTTYPRLNNQGQISGFKWAGVTNYAPLIWNRGVWLDIRTLPIVQPGFAALRALHINDRGQILCRGTVPGKSGEHPMLLTPSPGLFATFLFPTNRLSLGEELDFTVRVVNGTLETLNDVRIVSLEKDSGAGGLERVSGPTPGNPVSLPRGGFVEQQYRYRATNGGSFVFAANLEGRRTNNTLLTARSLSDPLKIIIRGDLLIKRAAESASRYAIDNEYQSNPSGQQVRTNLAKLTGSAEFQVKIENDDPQPRTFVLKATDYGTNGWDLKYLFNGQDIAAQLAASGFTLPQLASNASHTITVRMTPTNAPGGDQRRVLLQLESSTEPGVILDIVEAVTDFAAEIIVNSTGDQPDASLTDTVPDVDLAKPGLQTTFRCAIDFANRREGADIIEFQIPANEGNWVDGVPRIEPATALPDITETVIVDGWTQNLSATAPPIELSGVKIPAPPGFPANQAQLAGKNGLTIDADGCVIVGLVISWFPDFGIELLGDDNVVSRCFIGTDSTGQFSRANGVTSDDWVNFTSGGGICVGGVRNQIGGGPGLGNLISGSDNGFRTIRIHGSGQPASPDSIVLTSGPGILLLEGADETQIYHNLIGTTRSSDFITSVENGFMLAGVLAYSDANAIGDVPQQESFGNLIGNCVVGIALRGSFNDVRGNQLGFGNNGTRVGNFIGIDLQGTDDRIGHPEAGNVLVYNQTGIRALDAERFVIENNSIGFSTAVKDGSQSRFQDIGIEVLGRGHDSQIRGNDVGFHLFEGIRVGGDGRPVNGLQIVENNVVRNGRAGSPPARMAGIRIASGVRNGISMNQVYENTGRSISLVGIGNEDGLAGDEIDEGDGDSGPNTLLNYPELSRGTLVGTTMTVQGDLWMRPLNLPYRLEFYASSVGYWEGKRYLGYADFNTDNFGRVEFDAVFSGGAVVGEFISATAIDPDGNTSQFSNPVQVCTGSDGDGDGICDELEAGVPDGGGASLGQGAGGGIHIASDGGDGNGDGLMDSEQANVSSFIGIAGKWLTLAGPNGVSLKDVIPTGPPDFTKVPSGYTFPVGFVSFSVTGLVAGATIAITNVAHDANAYTTVFAYGRTPDNPQPHWYEFFFDGTTGGTLGTNQVVLMFRDGARGDHDLATNGVITTILAPACLVPPGPPLQLLSTSVSLVEQLEVIQVSTNAPVLITNQVSAVTSVLAWPASATDYFPEYAEALSPTNIWRPILSTPALIGDQLVVTNTSLDSIRFYRLHHLPTATVASPAPTLNIQRTTTNTFLLSWPSSFTGLALQQNTNLVTGTWASVTNVVNVSDGQNQVILPPATGSRFFRLKPQ